MRAAKAVNTVARWYNTGCQQTSAVALYKWSLLRSELILDYALTLNYWWFSPVAKPGTARELFMVFGHLE